MNDTSVDLNELWKNEKAIACRHIVRAVEAMSERRVGHHVDPSDKKLFPTAWCDACNKALAEAGGKWTAEVKTRAGFKEVCPCCYVFARAENEPGAIVDAFGANSSREESFGQE